MIELLNYPFMINALILGLVLGTLYSLIGVFVVTKGMSFFSDFIAHSSILGGAIAVIIGIEASFVLIPFCVIVGFMVSIVWNSFPLSRDTVLGAFYGGLVSIGIIVISVKGLSQTYLMQLLFGDILLISPTDIWLSSGLLAGFLVFLIMNMRRLIKTSFLPEISRAEGVDVRLYDYALVGFIALTIALSIKVVGVVLANAMVVLPGASAKTLSRSFRQFIIIAPLIGVTSFVLGIAVSFYLNTPSGPSVVAVSFIIFIMSLIAGAVKK